MAKQPEMITPEQIKAFHALYGKLKPPVDKSDMVMGYSYGRTSSSKELTKAEATAMIKALKSIEPEDIQKSACEKMRRKIISLAHEMGWRLEGGKIDMAHINSWCVKNSPLKKKLDAHTYRELPALVSQFEKVYFSYLDRLDKTA